MWPEVMLLGIGANGVDEAPSADVRDAPAEKMAVSIFFLAWILLGHYFCTNLIVGVVVDSFKDMKGGQDGSGLLTEEQRAWSDALRAICEARAIRLRQPPPQPWRSAVFRLVTSSRFEVAVVALVVLNMACMAADQYPGSPELEVFLGVTNLTFTVAFTVEAILRLVGLGPVGWASDRWNIADAALVLVAWVAFAAEELAAEDRHLAPFLLRVARIFRILRVLKAARSIRQLARTLVNAIPAVANVACLLFVVLFGYAAVGVNIWHGLADGQFVNDDANFRSFGMAMLLLLRCMTGESWNGIMRDAIVQEDARGLCAEAAGTCGVHEAIGALYFYSFVLLTSLVILNLVIALVVAEQAALRALSPTAVESFQEVRVWRWDQGDVIRSHCRLPTTQAWSSIDEDGTYVLPTALVPELLFSLAPPLGCGAENRMSRGGMLSFVEDLSIPDHEGLVSFHETLLCLARARHGKDLPTSPFTMALARDVVATLQTRGLSRLPESKTTAAEVFAALLLQRAWRGARSREASTTGSATTRFPLVPTILGPVALGRSAPSAAAKGRVADQRALHERQPSAVRRAGPHPGVVAVLRLQGSGYLGAFWVAPGGTPPPRLAAAQRSGSSSTLPVRGALRPGSPASNFQVVPRSLSEAGAFCLAGETFTTRDIVRELVSTVDPEFIPDAPAGRPTSSGMRVVEVYRPARIPAEYLREDRHLAKGTRARKVARSKTRMHPVQTRQFL